LRVLVTGGAGFIGHHVVKLLADSGFTVAVADNLENASARGLRTLEEAEIPVFRVDVRDADGLGWVFDYFKADAVIHCAALINVEESISKPDLYADVNVRGTAVTASLAAKKGVGTIVYMSSAAVYGQPHTLPIGESHPTEPISPYGATKLGGEHVCLSLSKSLGYFKAFVLRLFNVYGPGQDYRNPYSGVIARFAAAALRGSDLEIFGDGLQSRDFIHVSDVARAALRCLDEGAVAGVYNIGSGRETSILELARSIIALTGSSSRIVHREPRPGDIRRSVADVSRAREALGWAPTKSLGDGLRETIEWIRLDEAGGHA